MESNRLPRFERVRSSACIHLTERDREIVRLIQQHRFLRSSQVISLVGGSSQAILRRLQLLYHHGYLERPRAQIEYYHQGGSRHIVYGIGNKGAALLKEQTPTIRWGEKNRSIGRVYLEHALLVSDFMVTLEIACRKMEGVRLIRRDELAREKSFKWNVHIGEGVKLGVVPDQVSAFEFNDHDGEPERAYFFLEADRGTMPVQRRNLAQTSFYRKLLAYEATWTQGLHRSRFGFHRFRVLTVTTSAERMKSLVEACSQLKRGQGLFLFTDQSILNSHDGIRE